ncbi:MAG: sigma-54-dependent Fis family transcriptional regulator [Desulfobacterales bacterium]|nr:sigma-54-dependent Fis family transcriptional regulator [Desulfobacterales bacterium]
MIPINDDIIIISKNAVIESILQYVEAIATTSQPVLITGETGAGKELIAKAIHHYSKLNGPMVTVNVSGLDDNMFSDTLFGHLKGSFTGATQSRVGLVEQSTNGTLFLDEIGDLNQSSQVKLLRLIQEGEYLPLGSDRLKKSNARMITATNHDLWLLQKSGMFRKDLNFRLRTHHIHLPPLRERKEDIPLLVEHFLQQSAISLNKKKPTPPKELFMLLETYSFPGNVRELKSMVFNAVSLHKSKMLSLDTFEKHIQHARKQTGNYSDQKTTLPIMYFPEELPTIKHIIHDLIHEALTRSGGNMTIAAKMLGISRQALSKRLQNTKNGVDINNSLE